MHFEKFNIEIFNHTILKEMQKKLILVYALEVSLRFI